MEFRKLIVGRNRSGCISVVTQLETAEYFGWDREFQEWNERSKSDGWGQPVRKFAGYNDGYGFPGGSRLRICRSAKKTGHPQGQTHCFRMQGCWSRKHLVELARVAGEKFEWMENKARKRVDRDVWLSLVG